MTAQAVTAAPQPKLPGYWRFIWMFFMQPIRLHRLLRACGIDDPDAPAWRLWRFPQGRGGNRLYVRRMAWLLLYRLGLISAARPALAS